MDQFAIVATFDIVPGRMDEFLPLLGAHRDRCLKDEPGTVGFDVLRPRNDEHQVMLYEVYTDDAAFQVHWNGRTSPACARRRRAWSRSCQVFDARCWRSADAGRPRHLSCGPGATRGT
jgi:(4S)-4-hydroxy-5-phosphonooxypentane-2,3-dione isomerase